MTSKPNRLAGEKSPYLRQHAYNPVEWYPWGQEAFDRARSEGKPIFLSVGYSTCHWCHVMEKESFENEEIAALLNAHFVAVKVDREERPDVDRIYMSALQAMGQDGGWPMSMFLLPDLKPFWGGTYFPPAARYGRAGFPDILRRINDVWSSERGKAEQAAESIVTYLNDLSRSAASGERAGTASLDLAFQQLSKTFDRVHGGFGGGPKFPRPPALEFLLRYAARTGSPEAREIIETTLDRMAAGGVYDHIGGGFHRYAIDREWRVPHFEKMLYDQAQLITCYSEAYLLTGKPAYARVVRETAGYVLRDMTGPGGGFYSAEDADSPRPEMPGESGEGAFYLWTKDEIGSTLGPAAAPFFVCYGVEAGGNAPFDPQEEFTGKNILYAAQTPESAARILRMSTEEVGTSLDGSKSLLLEQRKARPRPHLDDKVLTSWNGLMISALSKAGRGIGDLSFVAAAERAAEFVFDHLYVSGNGTLKRRFREGEAKYEAYLDDYAFLTQGLIDLYESTGSSRWLEESLRLTEKQIALFWDEEHGAFFDTTGRDPSILVRIKEHYDGAEPTGNSVAAMNLLRLAQMLDRPEWRRKADRIFDAFAPILAHQPVALPALAAAMARSHAIPAQVVLAGDPSHAGLDRLRQKVFERFRPDLVILYADAPDGCLAKQVPAVRGMVPVSGQPAAYVCRDFVCKMPTSDPAELGGILEAL